MIRVAIIDSTCRLSAFPSYEEFQTMDYSIKGRALIICEADLDIVEDAWMNRDMAYVLPIGSAKPVDLPEDAFVLYIDLSLNPPIVSTAV